MKNLQTRRLTTKRFSKEKFFLPPPFIDLPEGLTNLQVEEFLKEQRVEELGKRVRANVLERRSPSPVRGGLGRDEKLRKDMEEEYSRVIRSLLKTLPGYIPPADWIPTNAWKRVFLPVDEYPSCNFVDTILGKRGQTHIELQHKSKCRIEIRGRDVVSQTQSSHDARLPLHVYIEGDDEDDVERALDLLTPLIDPTSEDFKKLHYPRLLKN